MYVDAHDSIPAHIAGIQYVAEDPKFNNWPNTSMTVSYTHLTLPTKA